MDFKKAIESTLSLVNVNKDLDEIITTHDYEEIKKHVDTLTPLSSPSVTEDDVTNSLVLAMLNDNEDSLYVLLQELKTRFYFQGLMCHVTTLDIFDILLKTCTFELYDEDSYILNSDEELHIS